MAPLALRMVTVAWQRVFAKLPVVPASRLSRRMPMPTRSGVPVRTALADAGTRRVRHAIDVDPQSLA